MCLIFIRAWVITGISVDYLAFDVTELYLCIYIVQSIITYRFKVQDQSTAFSAKRIKSTDRAFKILL